MVLKSAGKSVVIDVVLMGVVDSGLCKKKRALSSRIEGGLWTGLTVGLCIGSKMIGKTISLCRKRQCRDLCSGILVTLDMVKPECEW